jgi:polyisoprenoid-binding protein YceI
VTFTIQTASVDSRNDKRNQHLMSPDFFSVKEFPTIEFKSTEVKAAGKDEYEVKGKLTLHGVTKDLTLKVQQVGQADGEKGKVAGFETHTTIKRSDYGMGGHIDDGMLGDDVDVIVSVEAHAE